MVGFAQRSIAERGLANVKLICADAAATGLVAESLDLGQARLILVNLTSPRRVVAEMARAVRPGGWVAVQDVDWITWTCEPSHPAWDSLLDALVRAWAMIGLGLITGHRIPGFLRDTGLIDVAIEVRGHTRRNPPWLTSRCHLRLCWADEFSGLTSIVQRSEVNRPGDSIPRHHHTLHPHRTPPSSP